MRNEIFYSTFSKIKGFNFQYKSKNFNTIIETCRDEIILSIQLELENIYLHNNAILYRIDRFVKSSNYYTVISKYQQSKDSVGRNSYSGISFIFKNCYTSLVQFSDIIGNYNFDNTNQISDNILKFIDDLPVTFIDIAFSNSSNNSCLIEIGDLSRFNLLPFLSSPINPTIEFNQLYLYEEKNVEFHTNVNYARIDGIAFNNIEVSSKNNEVLKNEIDDTQNSYLEGQIENFTTQKGGNKRQSPIETVTTDYQLYLSRKRNVLRVKKTKYNIEERNLNEKQKKTNIFRSSFYAILIIFIIVLIKKIYYIIEYLLDFILKQI